MSDRKRKCPHCGELADEYLIASGGFGVGDYQWGGDCDKCGASWEYWQRGRSPERLHLDISFDEYDEEEDEEDLDEAPLCDYCNDLGGDILNDGATRCPMCGKA